MKLASTYNNGTNNNINNSGTERLAVTKIKKKIFHNNILSLHIEKQRKRERERNEERAISTIFLSD